MWLQNNFIGTNISKKEHLNVDSLGVIYLAHKWKLQASLANFTLSLIIFNQVGIAFGLIPSLKWK